MLEELHSEKCQGRMKEILEGDRHAGFPIPKEFEDYEVMSEIHRLVEPEDPWTFRKGALDIARNMGCNLSRPSTDLI